MINFESLKDKILLYKKERFVKLRVRDSRSVEVVKERVKHYLSDDIYYGLTYWCIHGGKEFNVQKKVKDQCRK